MVNTRTDTDLTAALQNALQTLLPQIREEIREEFHTGSGSSNAVTWADFKKLFFLQFFQRAEQERLKREYHSIRKTSSETNTEFMQRFLRLAGFLGRSGDRHQPTSQQSSYRSHGQNNDRHGCDRRGGNDNHHGSNNNNNYSRSNNRNSGNRRDQRNRGHQSNRSTNSGSQESRGPSEGYSYPRSGDRHLPTSQQSSHKSHGQNNDRHGSDRRGGNDNHRG
nr:zinc finger, CCHC-type, retrotransposon Gag domain protein [Tanacetum cinerariifolium]